MTIVYRSEKGSNLTAAEIDGNFHDVDDRINFIEENPPEPVIPVSATMTAGSYTLGFSNGTSYTVTFVQPMPQWRGTWQPSTTYHELDYIIGTDGGWGAVLQDHVSGATFDWAATDGSGNPLYRKLVGATGETGALGNLTDVAVDGAADGAMLVLQAGYWVDYTPAEVTATLAPFVGDSGAGGLQGLVPAPAPGDAVAGKVLGAGGAWIVPPSGSGGGSSSLAGLSDVSISSPVNLSLLQYFSADGKWHNASLSALGAGTVTAVYAGAGLAAAPSPIVATGTLSLAPITSGSVLANTAGVSAAPVGVPLTALLDAALGSARGTMVVRGATGWEALPPGPAGKYLMSNGAAADLAWDSPAGAGTVTSIATADGIVGGPISSSGTVRLAPVDPAELLANVTGAAAAPTSVPLTLLLDTVLGTTQGSLLVRTATVWSALAPGSDGQVLTTHGTGSDAGWAAASGGARVTIGATPPLSPAPAAGDLWWSSADGAGNLYVYFNDGTSSQWVIAVNQPGPQGPAGAANMTGMVAGQIPIAAGASSVTSSGNLSGDVTSSGLVTTLGTVPIAKGGSGQTAIPAAFNALAASGGTVGGNLTVTGTVTASSSSYQNIQVSGNSGSTYSYLGHQAGNGYVGTTGATDFNIQAGGTGLHFKVAGGATGIGDWTSSGLSIAGDITITGTPYKPGGGSWVAPSDRSIKSYVAEWNTGLQAVLALNPIAYRYNNDEWNVEHDYIGLDADEAAAIIPEMARTATVPIIPGEPETQTVPALEFQPLLMALVGAVKELKAEIDELKAQLPPPMQPRCN